MSDPVVLLSTGDVVGPAGGVTDNSMVLFSGTSGKLIKGNNAVVTAAGLALLDDVNAAAQRTTLGLGTAATANVTTSATDTTADRVLKVGDFGLGGFAIALNYPNLNAPNPYASGLYYANSPTNQPAGEGNGYFIQEVLAGNYTRQTFVGVAAGKTYTRVLNNSVWTAWVEIWTTNNLVKTTSATDTTAGSMLKVGDFGFNGPSIVTGAGADLNWWPFAKTDANARFQGYRWVNMPEGCSNNVAVVEWQTYSGDWGRQLFVDITYRRSYERYWYSGTTWSPWREIARIDSPAFTGTPTAPTAAAGTNTTQLATTEFAYGLASKAQSGYVRLPNGVIIQWADLPSGTTAILFPIAFPTLCASVVIGQNGAASSTVNRVGISSMNTTALYLQSAVVAGAVPARYIAIGY